MIGDQIFYCLQSVHSLLCKWRQLTSRCPDFSALQKTNGLLTLIERVAPRNCPQNAACHVSNTLIGAGKKVTHLRSRKQNFLSSEGTYQGTKFLSLLFIFFSQKENLAHIETSTLS